MWKEKKKVKWRRAKGWRSLSDRASRPCSPASDSCPQNRRRVPRTWTHSLGIPGGKWAGDRVLITVTDGNPFQLLQQAGVWASYEASPGMRATQCHARTLPAAPPEGRGAAGSSPRLWEARESVPLRRHPKAASRPVFQARL